MTYPVSAKPRLKVGQILPLEVERLSAKGQGVSSFGGQEILVRQGLPGDQLQARLTKVRPYGIEAQILEIQRPSPARVTPRCAHFGPCGGCDLQHMDYPQQVQWKLENLEAVLAQEGGLRSIPPIEVVPMEDPWGYRSKMEFSFGQEGDRITLGLHQRGSFQRIVDITTCHIAPPTVSELLGAMRETAGRFPLKSYNPKIHQGFWRYAVVRSSRHAGELMLLVVTNEGSREPIDALAVELPKRVPTLKSLYWGVSTRVSDVALAERLSFIWGQEMLEDRIGDLRFVIRPTNFVQPNLILASQIYRSIQKRAQLTGNEVVYDLYCGIGLIALFLAHGCQAVYGVESEPENVAQADQNARLNGLTNASFLCGKVEDLLRGRALFKAGPRPDRIVVDPPRAGLHKEVYAPLLSAQAPVLMYLSCNPVSLARDLKILLERDPGYRVEAVELFDFFPHTTHVEVLVTLRR